MKDQSQDREIWIRLTQCRHAVFRILDRDSKQVGLGAAQAELIFALKTMGEMNITPISANIARWLFRKPHTVSSLINTAERNGLIRRLETCPRRTSCASRSLKGEKNFTREQKKRTIIPWARYWANFPRMSRGSYSFCWGSSGTAHSKSYRYDPNPLHTPQKVVKMGYKVSPSFTTEMKLGPPPKPAKYWARLCYIQLGTHASDNEQDGFKRFLVQFRQQGDPQYAQEFSDSVGLRGQHRPLVPVSARFLPASRHAPVSSGTIAGR